MSDLLLKSNWHFDKFLKEKCSHIIQAFNCYLPLIILIALSYSTSNFIFYHDQHIINLMVIEIQEIDLSV